VDGYGKFWGKYFQLAQMWSHLLTHPSTQRHFLVRIIPFCFRLVLVFQKKRGGGLTPKILVYLFLRNERFTQTLPEEEVTDQKDLLISRSLVLHFHFN